MTVKIQKVAPYHPKPWQIELHNNPARFRVAVIARGEGKSWFAANELIMKALNKKRGKFFYLSPYKTQCKANIWDEFKYFLSFIPGVVFHEVELKITFPSEINGKPCGSVIKLLGADEPNTLRGSHYDGGILDEVDQMHANTWKKVVRPTLKAKKGWAVFIGTFEGKQLLYELYQRQPSGNPLFHEWSSTLLTILDIGGKTEKELEEMKADMGEEAFDQEEMCNPNAATRGAFYGKSLAKLWEDGHMGDFPHDPNYPVITAWDLGARDSTAVWFAQIINDEVWLIDYFEDSKIPDLNYYIDVLKSKSYKYKQCLLPHDGVWQILGMAQTRYEQIKAAGLNPRKVPKLPVMEGINAVRSVLGKCRFNTANPAVMHGLNALMIYRPKYNERLGVASQVPIHCDASDSFRYLATGIKLFPDLTNRLQVRSYYNIKKPELLEGYQDYNIHDLI